MVVVTQAVAGVGLVSVRYHYLFFLQWLSIVLVVVFGIFLSWQYGFLAALFENDKSYISSIILVIFFLTTITAGFRTIFLSRELDRAQSITEVLLKNRGKLELQDNGQICSGDTLLPECLLQSQLYKQLLRNKSNDRNSRSHVMLSNMEREISSGHDFGWLVADMMIKLGLLGTVIGFIVMLGSVAVIENADIATIQNMLTDMSDGMRIALFTTLTGLLAGLLLGLQYHFLDRAAGRLTCMISDTVETYVGQ
jgi:biopolymer transport protein ExbB/TolQ